MCQKSQNSGPEYPLLPKIGTSHERLRHFGPEYPLPKIGTYHGDFSWRLRNFGPEYPHPHPRFELLMEDFVSETGVGRKLLYPPKIDPLSRLSW